MLFEPHASGALQQQFQSFLWFLAFFLQSEVVLPEFALLLMGSLLISPIKDDNPLPRPRDLPFLSTIKISYQELLANNSLAKSIYAFEPFEEGS